MASDGIPVIAPVTRLVHGSRAQTSSSVQVPSGKALPGSGKTAPAEADAHAAQAGKPTANESKKPDVAALLAQLNSRFNTSGQPDQFRLNIDSGHTVIQQVNPVSGEVIGEFPESEFPALAQGLGGPGALFNTKV
ncbi:MAG TPA: flagellar protein FlaG [Steroidobacteraceae bacterium]|jgi:uncharacterized FlaG/YvyC family protein